MDHHRHGPLLLLSLYYQQVQGKSAIVTGLILAPQGIAVETFDERLTTVSAARALRAAGRDARAQRSRIDQSAAAVLLQAWLDGRVRSGGDDA